MASTTPGTQHSDTGVDHHLLHTDLYLQQARNTAFGGYYRLQNHVVVLLKVEHCRIL